MPHPPALILFSGLAADAKVFLPQKLAFSQLVVPEWPRPATRESFSAYCERLAEGLREHGPCVLGGASFGGFVALEVAQYLGPLSVVLIGSVRSPAELPLYAKMCRPLAPLVPFFPTRLVQWMLAPAEWSVARKWAPYYSAFLRQFRGADPALFKWSLARVLDWRGSPGPDHPRRRPPDLALAPAGGERLSAFCRGEEHGGHHARATRRSAARNR